MRAFRGLTERMSAYPTTKRVPQARLPVAVTASVARRWLGALVATPSGIGCTMLLIPTCKQNRPTTRGGVATAGLLAVNHALDRGELGRGEGWRAVAV